MSRGITDELTVLRRQDWEIWKTEGQEKKTFDKFTHIECELPTVCAGGDVLQTAGGGGTLERVDDQGEEAEHKGGN